MQASKTPTDGSNAITLFEVYGIVGERLLSRAPGVDFGFQGENEDQAHSLIALSLEAVVAMSSGKGGQP